MSFDERRLEMPAVRELLAARCVCDLGRSRVEQMRPMTAEADLEMAIALVREYMNLLAERTEPPIHELRDVTLHLRKVARERAILDPAELLDLRHFLETAGRMRSFLEPRRETCRNLHSLAMPLHHAPALIRSIDEKIGPDATVRDTASEALQRLRAEIFATEQRLQRELQKMVRSLADSGDLQDDFWTLRNDRYVLPVKSTNRGKVPGIIHDSSNTGETVFIEPFAILEESNHLADLKLSEREEIFRILLRVANHARDEMNVLLTNLEILAEFDFIQAKARFGMEFDGTFPVLTGPERPLGLAGAHHPLLYTADRSASRPLHLALDAADRVLIITGPNAGGKTTALKTIGLTALMLQCGVPVPADKRSHLPVFTEILAAIGDEQSVLEGESTFSAHMRRICEILRRAGPRALVLLDELGTATDPGEGGALAVAILESLAERGALTIVSTHLAVLKNWAEGYPGGRNASFRLDPTSHRPTFRLQLDVPGISEALVVAEQVGIPPEIIARARALRPEGELDATALILSLQEKENRLAAQLAATEEARAALETATVDMEAERRRLAEQRRKLRAEMAAEKERELAALRAKVEALLARQPSKQELLAAKRELEAAQSAAVAERREHGGASGVPDPATLQKGDRVRVASLNEDGTVEEVLPQRNAVRVRLRKVTATVAYDDLRMASEVGTPDGGVSAPPPAGTGAVSYKRPAEVPLSLDLHGMRVQEALEKTDQFLDRALAAGLNFVRLVHGHGTGAVRRALHEHLRGHPLVKRYRHGTPNEGGGSVTIVDLR
ncbi:MAG: Smr/MutS family protein [Candidatus Sumerlaeaceae bacterium]|nr:Smr/MutS family protein [Candidatus Sumerlaeaceae bacterium]